MVQASLTFTQSAVSPGAGISMIGVAGAVVTLSSANNNGVARWVYELLDTPLGSALVPVTLSSGTSQTATFTPDTPATPGCYRVKLTVIGTDGSTSSQIRNFAVPTAQGWILPPFRATAAELNFAGNAEGWEFYLNTIFLAWASGATDVVANVAALTALNDSVLADGSVRRVLTVLDSFWLSKTSSATVDGISVVATASATGRWLRSLQPSRVWGSQATWYIDAANGNDENDGATAATELATFAEFRRRVEPVGVRVPMTIEIQTNLPPTDLVGVDSFGEQVDIVGVRTTEYTGTVTNFTARTGTTGALVRDAGWTVSEHVRRFIRFTSSIGTALDKGGWILADAGANDARVSNIATDGQVWLSSGVPAVGDTFVVQSYPEVTLQTFQRYQGRLAFQNIRNSDPNSWVLVTNTDDTYFAGCVDIYMASLGGNGMFVKNSCGQVTAFGAQIGVWSGALGKISLYENSYLSADNSYVTVDVSLAGYASSAIDFDGMSYGRFNAEVDLFGDFGSWAITIGKYSKAVFESTSNIGGDITGTAHQGRLYDGASLYTPAFTHTFVGWGDGMYLYPDGVVVPINDGPVLIPGSLTQLGTGSNFGVSGPMRAGVKGALTAGTRYALPDYTESATDDLPLVAAGNSVARNLRGRLGAAPGGADTVVVTVYIDGAPSAITMTFTGAETTASDTTHNVILPASSEVSFHVVKTGALAANLTLTLEAA